MKKKRFSLQKINKIVSEILRVLKSSYSIMQTLEKVYNFLT